MLTPEQIDADLLSASPSAKDARTASELLFVQLVHKGQEKRSAWLKAFPLAKQSPSSASVSASKLLRRPDIQARLASLKTQQAVTVAVEGMLDRDAKRLRLARWIDDENADPQVRLRAIEIDNRMAGHDAPKVSVSLNPTLSMAKSLLDRYAQRPLPQQAGALAQGEALEAEVIASAPLPSPAPLAAPVAPPPLPPTTPQRQLAGSYPSQTFAGESQVISKEAPSEVISKANG